MILIKLLSFFKQYKTLLMQPSLPRRVINFQLIDYWEKICSGNSDLKLMFPCTQSKPFTTSVFTSGFVVHVIFTIIIEKGSFD